MALPSRGFRGSSQQRIVGRHVGREEIPSFRSGSDRLRGLGSGSSRTTEARKSKCASARARAARVSSWVSHPKFGPLSYRPHGRNRRESTPGVRNWAASSIRRSADRTEPLNRGVRVRVLHEAQLSPSSA